jgi:hypothetical protein
MCAKMLCQSVFAGVMSTCETSDGQSFRAKSAERKSALKKIEEHVGTSCGPLIHPFWHATPDRRLVFALHSLLAGIRWILFCSTP